jgi:hypothetical protein
MISNMVSEPYPREEDEECASAYGSENCEENQVPNDDSSSVFATMANKDPDIIFGNFHQESNLEKVQMLSINTINPSIEGNSIKIGAITCFIASEISQSTVNAFSSPIKVKRQHDGTVQFSQDHDQNSKKGETISAFLLCSSEIITFFSYYHDYGIIVFDPGGIMFVIYSSAILLSILSIFDSVSIFPFDPGGIFFYISDLQCFLAFCNIEVSFCIIVLVIFCLIFDFPNSYKESSYYEFEGG